MYTLLVFTPNGENLGGYSYIVWVGVCCWVRESPTLYLLDQILWPSTKPKMLNYSWFQSFVSNPVKRDPILAQFSMITRPYRYQTRNGLKTIPFTRPNGLKTNDTLNQTKWLENQNHTLSSGTYPYSQYMGVLPPPPPRSTGLHVNNKLGLTMWWHLDLSLH